MRIIAIMNHKGGVGKTTTSLNLGHALAAAGKRVTLIDMDPQGHLTISCGNAANREPGLDQLLMHQATTDEIIREVKPNLSLISAGPKLAEFEQQKGDSSLALRLRSGILEHAKSQDFVLIDCPPSSGLLVINSLFAATEVLVPVTGDYLALLGLSRLLGIFKHIEKAMKHSLPLQFVMTRFNPRRKLAKGIRAKMLQHFPGQVLATYIRESVALAESPGFQKSILEYQPKGYGAQDYTALAQDLIKRRMMKNE
ncbi:MAG: ParA family protein [Gammaproteobacteria bacterium]|nr:ParA family protein [Gammaproteobacteria bacterium]